MPSRTILGRGACIIARAGSLTDMDRVEVTLPPASPPGAAPHPTHLRRRSIPARIAFVAARTPHVLLMSQSISVGGQAVMEGVMMRGPHTWAVAVRRYDGSIAEVHRELNSFGTKHRWARIPIVRGVVALFEALIIGMKALFVSSEYAIDDVEAKAADKEAGREPGDPAPVVAAAPEPTAIADPGHVEEVVARKVHEVAVRSAGGSVPVEVDGTPDPDGIGTWAIVGAMIVAMAFSVLLFKVVPVTIATFLPLDRTSWAFVLIEACIKFTIFIVYLVLVGLMPDMSRVFQYHSAEHKAINAWERGIDLTPPAVNAMSRIHVRCGTAFIVWLFLVGMVVFRGFQLVWEQFIGSDPSRFELIASRPVLLPIVAGLSFEILRFAGRHADNGFLRLLLAPGLWFQRLTTRECTDDQCEVAVRSLELVLRVEEERAARVAAEGAAAEAEQDAFQVLA